MAPARDAAAAVRLIPLCFSVAVMLCLLVLLSGASLVRGPGLPGGMAAALSSQTGMPDPAPADAGMQASSRSETDPKPGQGGTSLQTAAGGSSLLAAASPTSAALTRATLPRRTALRRAHLSQAPPLQG